MRKFGILIFMIGLSTSLTFAQKQKSEPQEVDPGSKRSTPSKGDSASSAIAAGTRLEAVLTGTIDAKNAQVGDEVVMKTTSAIKDNGRTVVSKGSQLIGRVSEVSKRAKGSSESKLGIIFDRIEGKGLSSPVSATIVSITDARAAASVDDSADAMLSSQSSTRSTTSASGGGLLGGVGGTVGGLVNTTTQTTGAVVGSAAGTVGSTTGSLGKTLGGLQITNSANGSASGSTVLSSNDRNVRLEKGLKFDLLINSGQ